MSKLSKLLALFIIICWSNYAVAATNLKGMRLWPSPAGIRVVFDLNNSVKYKVTTLANPQRLVIDLYNTNSQFKFKQINLTKSGIKSVRTAQHSGPNKFRVVLELSGQLSTTTNHFVLPPYKPYGHRLVIDLKKLASISERDEILALFAKEEKTVKLPSAPAVTHLKKNRNFVIAIDPGHGGMDPGAVGLHGTREKDVTLAIAKKLKRLIDKEPGLQAMLTRSGDYYVDLRRRMNTARKYNAELFISIHADAVKKRSVTGASVYILSEHGASSEAARWLAARENKADLVGGVSLDKRSNVLAKVLLDLSQTASKRDSLKLAKHILQAMGRVTPLLRQHRVEQAGFAVLKAPDVPSILIETGFISNPRVEAQLRSDRHQQRLAEAILQGIRRYVKIGKNL